MSDIKYSEYVKPFPAPQYPVPLGGRAEVLIPGKVAVYNVAFKQLLFEIGNRCTAIVLDNKGTNSQNDGLEGNEQVSSDPFLTPSTTTTSNNQKINDQKVKDIVIINPIPHSPEAERLLRALVPEIPENEDIGKYVNIKYLVAGNIVHHMGLNSWKKAYPDAQIIGVSGLERKKNHEIKVDYEFPRVLSNVLISETLMYGNPGPDSYLKHLPLPRELLSEFDFVYIPDHKNKELVLLYKPAKILITSDLFFNLPATEQYSGCPEYAHFHPGSGFSLFTRLFSMNSWFIRQLAQYFLKDASPGIQALYDWNPKMLIPAHGTIISGNSTELFGKQFGNLVKTKANL